MTVAARRRTRWSLVLALLVLSPVCAEYLAGYDSTTGDPWQLVGGLLILGPLYGAPALLIREAARRRGLGWPGVLALSAAAGLLQAGVIDQSLFSYSYREIPYWQDMLLPTYLEALGLGVSPVIGFVGGHMLWSFAIPIALTEAMHPGLGKQPWLRRPGLIITSLLYVAAAALVLDDHLRNEVDHAAAEQVVGALVVAGLLLMLALKMREHAGDRARPVPKPLIVGGLSFGAALGFDFAPTTWPGVALTLGILGVTAVAVARLARSYRWSGRHVAALAIGALLARTVLGFFVTPIGNVPELAKYTHNVVLLLGAALLSIWIARRAKASAASSVRVRTSPASS